MTTVTAGSAKRHKVAAGKAHRFVATRVRQDVVVPIAYPDYEISTPVGAVPGLGHAGVLFIDGKTGTTKYYEYGRYDPANLGIVRQRTIPDVAFGKDDRPTETSLKATLKAVSRAGGHGGRISAVYIEVDPGKYGAMLKFAEDRKKQNGNPKRVPYSLLSNNCMTFAKETAEAGGASTPSVIIPSPNSYMGRLQDSFPPLEYAPSTNTLDLHLPKK